MRILIDEDRCTGHGRCYTLVASLFDADDHGKGKVLVEVVGDDQAEFARSAALNCPEQAISIVPD